MCVCRTRTAGLGHGVGVGGGELHHEQTRQGESPRVGLLSRKRFGHVLCRRLPPLRALAVLAAPRPSAGPGGWPAADAFAAQPLCQRMTPSLSGACLSPAQNGDNKISEQVRFASHLAREGGTELLRRHKALHVHRRPEPVSQRRRPRPASQEFYVTLSAVRKSLGSDERFYGLVDNLKVKINLESARSNLNSSDTTRQPSRDPAIPPSCASGPPSADRKQPLQRRLPLQPFSMRVPPGRGVAGKCALLRVCRPQAVATGSSDSGKPAIAQVRPPVPYATQRR